MANSGSQLDQSNLLYKDQCYYVVVISKVSGISIKRFNARTEAIPFIKSLVGTDVQVIPFEGYLDCVSQGSPKYLISANGNKYPLFDDIEYKTLPDPDFSLADNS